MIRNNFNAYRAFVILVTFILTACGGSSGGSSSVEVAPIPQPTLESVKILENKEAQPLIVGQSLELLVEAKYSDKSIKEIDLDQVEWIIADSSIIEIANGSVTAKRSGETTVSASYESIVSV